MKEKTKEIWVGENRFYLDEDNILHITAASEQNRKAANILKEATDTFKSRVARKMNIFLDLNKVRKTSPEARKIGQEMLEDEEIGKVAFFGLHPVARVVAAFIIGVSKKKNLRFFKTEEEALTWLKE